MTDTTGGDSYVVLCNNGAMFSVDRSTVPLNTPQQGT